MPALWCTQNIIVYTLHRLVYTDYGVQIVMCTFSLPLLHIIIVYYCHTTRILGCLYGLIIILLYNKTIVITIRVCNVRYLWLCITIIIHKLYTVYIITIIVFLII